MNIKSLFLEQICIALFSGWCRRHHIVTLNCPVRTSATKKGVQIISFAAGTASKGDFEMANQMKKVA